jgi:SAM-dependent methyltransferase
LSSLRPPQEKIFVGRGDFETIGRQWVDYFVAHCGLEPEESVLDVGSGIGRVAIPLTEYLTGRYEGMDIVRDGVEWCAENITPRFPNFRFTLVDVYNKLYNPEGTQHPREFPFPYEDDTFDFLFLTSVFTHMQPPEIDHYIAEFARVLRPGGRCLASVYLWDEDVQPTQPQLRFDQNVGSYRYNRGFEPEDVVAYDEAFIRRLFELHGFASTVDYGWWGRPPGATNKDAQDVIVARLAT